MLVAFHECVHSHAKSIDRVNEPSVEIERSPGPALVLAWPGPSYIAAERKEKPNHPRVCVMLFFFPLSLHRCFLPHLWCACVVCIFKVCKRRCLKKKMRAAMQLHAFPCDATLVHRGALSLDTNTEISCPHPLPSLTTSCNVIYKPSSSRVSLSFFFSFTARSLALFKEPKDSLCTVFLSSVFYYYFSHEERALSRRAVFSFTRLPPLADLLGGR